MRLTGPPAAGAIKLTFGLPGGQHTTVRVRPGASQLVNIAVCATGSWYATYSSNVRGLVGIRTVSVRATPPLFTPSPAACPVPQPVAPVKRAGRFADI
jgi:hypothetical protein